MLNEAFIIAHLKKAFPSFIGDDAATLTGNAEQSQVVTNDLLIEDIHFRTEYFSAKNLAHKALHVNLSDIAAMGAIPQFILCGIAIPNHQGLFAQEFFSSFITSCKNANVILVGGDTSRSPDKIFISITAIGTCPTPNIKLRTQAKVGNIICIAGHLGHAHIGFIACERKLKNLTSYKNKFLHPNAKIEEGEYLGSMSAVTSMMDLSDGLFIDLKRLCQASHVAACIEIEMIHFSKKFRQTCNTLSLDPLNTTLIGGEDYSLLFTVDALKYSELADEFYQQFHYPLTNIGKIYQGSGVHLTQNGQQREFNFTPFTHFGEEQ